MGAIAYPAFWFLLFFGLSYVTFSEFSISSVRAYMLTPILIFLSGWIFLRMGKASPEKALKLLITALVLGFAAHAFLNSLVNMNSERSEIIDFFQADTLSATCAGGINTIILSLLTCLIIEKKKIYKIGGFICFGIALLYASILASRTQFVIMLIVFIITFSLYLNEQKSSRIAGSFFGGVFSLCAFVGIIYAFNLLGFRSFIESTNIFIRMTEGNLDASDSIRIDRFFSGFLSLFTYPLGGSDSKYFHNMWLDIGRKSGLSPFAIMLLYTCITTAHVVRIFRCKRLETATRYLVLSVQVGLLINLFVEPAMEGMLNIVLTSILFNGAVECYYYRHARKLIMSSEKERELVH